MAWRIDEMVICGEIDNRRRGRVTGGIWLAGHPEPVQLELRGNCWRDLAGCALRFTNPVPRLGGLACISTLQAGVVGDITASRKVRVPGVSKERMAGYDQARQPFPWHLGNAFHLEWFSARNGRVVVETAAFELIITGEPAWNMSLEEERAQRQANDGVIVEYMRQTAAGRK